MPYVETAGSRIEAYIEGESSGIQEFCELFLVGQLVDQTTFIQLAKHIHLTLLSCLW